VLVLSSSQVLKLGVESLSSIEWFKIQAKVRGSSVLNETLSQL
jgi:hypothetical protein